MRGLGESRNVKLPERSQQQRQQWCSTSGSHACAENEVELLLNITLEHKVKKTKRKFHLTHLVLSVVLEIRCTFNWTHVKRPTRKVQMNTTVVIFAIYLLLLF